MLGRDTGEGGPNQESSISFATEIADYPNVVALAIDTDGTDGPTDIAGRMLDASTLRKAQKAHLDLHDHLRRHDVSPLLRHLRDAVVTRTTGTNVNDLRLILVAPLADIQHAKSRHAIEPEYVQHTVAQFSRGI